MSDRSLWTGPRGSPDCSRLIACGLGGAVAVHCIGPPISDLQSSFFFPMPLPYNLCFLVLAVLGYVAYDARWRGWGVPMAMVLATVGVWYLGDAIYNDYNAYRGMLGDDILASAWWQVLWFLVAFGALTPLCHRWVNARFSGRRGHVMAYLEYQRFRHPKVQRSLDRVASGLFFAWGMLMVVALIQVRGDFAGLFAPYLGQKADPWSRGQIGGGLSAVISFASYLQIFLTAACGVMAALARNPKTRSIAVLICVLALPYYIFDRTRNTMLATVLPGMLAFILMRLRLGWLGKIAALTGAFLLVNLWFTQVMANRSGMSFNIKGALAGESEAGEREIRHEGLNMFEELAWIEFLSESGRYEPNWGNRYFAELVNPIPRGLWKNKPMIGLDYALARGQGVAGPNGETTATISTGMIGQGVVNFGPFFGPAAAALLMALWVALLARQDFLGIDTARVVIYGTGLILTFNLGRDITLLVLYPFFFGLGLLWILTAYHKHQRGGKRRSKRPKEAANNRLRILAARQQRREQQEVTAAGNGAH